MFRESMAHLPGLLGCLANQETEILTSKEQPDCLPAQTCCYVLRETGLSRGGSSQCWSSRPLWTVGRKEVSHGAGEHGEDLPFPRGDLGSLWPTL